MGRRGSGERGAALMQRQVALDRSPGSVLLLCVSGLPVKQ